MSSDALGTAIAGTVVLFIVSAAMAVGLALAMAAGSGSSRRGVRAVARAAVHVSRGVPTALLVIFAGLASLRGLSGSSLPVIFPGTDPAFQSVAWALTVALAVGSAGHLAEIFLAAGRALGPARLDAARALGLPRPRRLALLAREAAAIALPPTGARLVHHLHNTAFAALFPVTEMFGHVEAEANATFDVSAAVLTGVIVYVTLSGLIWALTRTAEALLAPGGIGARARTLAPRWSSTS